MTTSDINELIAFLEAALTRTSLVHAKTRVWIWKNECAVLDLKMGGAKFGFNLTPTGEGNCDLDFVPRSAALQNIEPQGRWGAKHNLLRAVSPETAWEMILETLPKLRTAPAKTPPTSHNRTVEGVQVAAGDFRTSRPRVGIVTLPLNRNFGGNLQAFALADTLSRLGVEPVLLDRRKNKENSDPITLTGRFTIHAAPLNTAFIRQNIPAISVRLTNTRQFTAAVRALGLSAVITGSDQVWRPRYAKKLLGDLFLSSLADTGVRRLSYAASFGADNWEFQPADEEMAKAALSGFDAVSCREDAGVEMCAQHLHVQAAHVLDPTFLVPLDRYRQVTKDVPTPPSAENIAVYVLDKNPLAAGVIAQLSGALGMSAYATDGHPYAEQDPLLAKDGDGRPEHWIASIAQAGLVVTDSFHGMVFAIMFNRPFVVFANPDRGLARFTSLLGQLGLSDRLIMDTEVPEIEALLRPVDWAQVNVRLDKARAASLDFLRKGLGLRADAGDALPAHLPVDTAHAQGQAWRQAQNDAAQTTLPVLCTGCGACAQDGDMGWSESGFLKPATGTIAADALKLCPFSPLPDALDEDTLGAEFLGTAPHYHPDGGYYEATFIGRSEAHRATSSSGGIATWVFERLLRDHHVDTLFVVTGDERGGYCYRTITDYRSIRQLSKTRYYPVTLAELYGLIAGHTGRVAISGVACFVKSVRLRQVAQPELRDKIAFVTGIICGGLKSSLYSDYLAASAGIEGAYRDADYREKDPESHALDYFFSADDEQGQRKRVRMTKLGDMWGSGLFKAKACDFCTDVTTELADLSLGDAWLPKYVQDGMGTSVVVARSPLAAQLIRQGIAEGELVLSETTMKRILRSQQGGFDHKRKTLAFRVKLAHQTPTHQVPQLRTRVLTPVSAAEAVVQILRERVRAKSHVGWQHAPDLPGFNRRMAKARNQLQLVTRMRKKNSADMNAFARDYLGAESTDQMPVLAGDMAVLAPVARWLRREIAANRTSRAKIGDLINL